MEIWQKFNFTVREKEIYEIAQVYQKFNKKRGDFKKYLPIKTDPRESKNWKYFEQLYSIFESDSTFDIYIFMEAQYRNLEKTKVLYPAQLKTKSAIEKYKEHRENKKMVDVTTETERMLINITNTYKFLKKWWKRKELPINDYESFFAVKTGEIVSEGFSYCLQGMISKYFMATSKTFNKYYQRLDPDVKWEIIPPDELKSYRMTLKLNEEAWEFTKEIFGQEVA